jgi:hypothetical protein
LIHARSHRFVVAVAFALVVSAPCRHAFAQAPDPQAIAAQKEAMKSLSIFDGTWRGLAWILMPGGEKLDVTQTERVGSFLDGGVKVIEGRGYDASGNVAFNAFGIVSYDAAKKTYSLRTYAMGRVGDFPLTTSADGFSWEHLMGPITIRYTATIKNGEWHEVGERMVKGQPPVKFMEMTLKRIGDSDWPAGGAVPAKE